MSPRLITKKRWSHRLRAWEDKSLYEADDRFVRLQSMEDPIGTRYELQTCVTTLEKINEEGEKLTVDLHGLIHFGQEDYFEYYNDLGGVYDGVFYELIVSQDLLQGVDEALPLLKRVSVGTEGLMPSNSDAVTAQRHDLRCQVDVIDYSQSNWFCADMSREQLQSMGYESSSSPAGAEVLQALLRPTNPSTFASSSSSYLTSPPRRLFSNLFLPGQFLTSVMRSLLWTVPAPELSVMLLDWSTLTPPPGGISPMASPILASLLRADFQTARKLVFSQMVVSSQRPLNKDSVVVGKRNDCALQTLMSSFSKYKRNALVYGAFHCRDLQQKLEKEGFRPIRRKWHTAWSVSTPLSAPATSVTPSFQTAFSQSAPLLSLLSLYLIGSAYDWAFILQSVTQSLFETHEVFDAFLEMFVYLVRHLAFYLIISKFVVEWDGSLFFSLKENNVAD